jgi:hypothetical protein
MGWLREIFNRKSSALETVARLELKEAEERAWPVYQSNLRTYLSKFDLLHAIENKYGYQKINDMFLWGVMAAFLSGRSALPTDAHSRISLLMIQYFAKGEEMPLDNARARANTAKELFDTMNPFFEAVIEAGATAYEQGGNEYLLNAHNAAKG